MVQVIVQPAAGSVAQSHYSDTIEAPVPLTRIFPFLADDQAEMLTVLYPDGHAPVWGVTPPSESLWRRIEPGDIALFSGHGKFYSSGTVTYKLQNSALAMELWDANEKGETWEYIYFIDSLQSIDIPYVQFNQTVGYQSNFVPQGFMVLNEERSSSYFDEHEIQITQTQYAALATALNELESFDKPGSVLNRVEQGILRRIHIGDNLNRTCGMCDRSLPASLLVAAHIKKRAECTQDDKRDVYNIAMPMCALGCDPLFEKGYISVQDGVIVVSKASHSSGTELVKVLNILEGKICGSWNENNKKYFAWHMKNTFKD